MGALSFFRRAIGIAAVLDRLHNAENRIARRLDAIARRLDALEEQSRLQDKWRARFNRKLDAVLRREYLADFVCDDHPFAAVARRFQLFSQNEEDGIVLALLQAAGVTNRTFVEIGSGRSGGNSGMLAGEFGWRGVMVDRDATDIARAARHFGGNVNCTFERLEVTPDNVDSLIERHGLAGEIDFFSLDIDSFDYWVLKAMTVATPRVMVLEYNALFGAERAVTIAPDTDLSRAPKGFHGASLRALTDLAAAKGYKLLACDPTGTNAFYMRADLRPEFAPVPVDVAFRPIQKMGYSVGETTGEQKDMNALARTHGLTLVDV